MDNPYSVKVIGASPYRIKVTGANPYTVRIKTAAQGPQGVQGPQGEQGLPGAGYTLPIATNTVLGGVKVGNNLTIDGDGVLSAGNNYVLPPANATSLGGIIVGDNLTITANGVLSGVNSYTLPAATNSTLGGVIVGNGLTVQANGSISVSTNYIKDDAANGTLTITGDAGSTTADLLSETTGSHFQSTVNNSGSYGFVNWYLKNSIASQVITWGGYGIDTTAQAATISYNYAPNFGSGISYGRSIKISGSDITFEQSVLGGASLPAKVWTANSILTKSYADSQYLPTANFTYANITGKPTLATVATSGSYIDLTNKPALFDGSYTSLTNVPATFAPSAHTHTVSQITDFPTFATVATTGLYSDLTGTPDLTGYLTTASASSTYLTISTAASTYQTVSGMSSYLTTATAASTYATTSSLSSYLTTATAASTYQPIGSYATTGANTFSGTQSLAGNIVDKPRLQAARDTKTTPAISGGTLTLDLNTSNFFAVSLNAAITTLTISNVPTGVVASFVLEFTADGTARAVSWPASFRFPSGTTPTLTTTSGKKDVFVVYTADDGTTFDIVIAGQNL